MVYEFVELAFLNRKYLEISVWSFNIYELHTFLGQVNIILSESLIYDEQEYWFDLGERWNQVRLEQFIRWPASLDKEKSPLEFLEKQPSERPIGKTKSAGVRWSTKLSTFRQLLSAGDPESSNRFGVPSRHQPAAGGWPNRKTQNRV